MRSYRFKLYMAKLGHKFFWNLLFPLALFVLVSPLGLMIIYFLENQVQSSIAELTQNNYEVGGSETITYSPATKPSDSAKLHVEGMDYRALVLDEYFKRNKSPLEGYGEAFVAACDKYEAPFDCTTLPAIAYLETALCKYGPSQKQKNCWGFGGSGANRINFKSYEDAIDLITDRLVNAYGPEYMTNPVSMQYIYCGPNCHKWGEVVQGQRLVMNQLAIDMGLPPLIR